MPQAGWLAAVRATCGTMCVEDARARPSLESVVRRLCAPLAASHGERKVTQDQRQLATHITSCVGICPSAEHNTFGLWKEETKALTEGKSLQPRQRVTVGEVRPFDTLSAHRQYRWTSLHYRRACLVVSFVPTNMATYSAQHLERPRS